MLYTKYIIGGSIIGVVAWWCSGMTIVSGKSSLRRQSEVWPRNASLADVSNREGHKSDYRGRVALSTARGCWSRVGNPACTTTTLFDAIREVESGGDEYAVGDGGASLGQYQISSDYWTDAIEFGGVQWDYNGLIWSRPHCELIMTWYWARYGAITDEQRARMHNGGPTMRGTDGYWRKVQSVLLHNGAGKV